MASLKNTTPKTYTPTGTPAGLLRTTVNGSGYITGIFTSENPSYIGLVVDGTQIIPSSGVAGNGTQIKGGISMLHRFKTSFSLYSYSAATTANIQISYTLD